MSKQQKKSIPTKTSEVGFSFSKIIPEKYQTAFFLILLLLLILLFFAPITFGDKTTSSGDLIQVKSLREYATKERDGVSLWNPHIFCGMPAVATSMSLRWYDLTAVIYSYTSQLYSSFLSDYNAIYTFSFFILGITSFLFMRMFGGSRGVSFLVAFATVFSSGIIVLFYIGHITKLMSLAVFPFILMMLFKFQKEIKLFDILLFTFAMHLLVLGAHVQIVFYFGLTALIYFIYFFTHSFITKNSFLQKQLFKSVGISIIAGLISLLMSFDTYSQLYEYKPYSTRSTKSITETNSSVSSNQNTLYEYNTNWSFSPGEVLTFFVPSYYGFGKSTYNGPLTQNQDVEVNTYFGQMPFVDSAMYMGIIIFVLGLFALFVRWKEPIIRFLGITFILFLLISFGKNFSPIFNLFYNYFPLFDNFRVPSMILHVLQIIFPILAGLGIMKIISLREEKNERLIKLIKNFSFILSTLFALSLLFGGSISSWFAGRVTTYAASLGQNQEAQMFSALAEYMADMFRGDLQIALVLTALTFGISYFYIIAKLNKDLFITAVIVFIMIDLFRISSRGAGYRSSSDDDNLFREPQYISIIKNQNEKDPYRILNLKQDGSMGTLQNNSNFNVYFLQEDFFGYSAVKPRSYQDIMDVVGPVNNTLWNMLGVKYIVTEKPLYTQGFTTLHQSDNLYVHRNDNALPRIYFVDSVRQKLPMEILYAIKEELFKPKEVAYIEKADLKIDKPDSSVYAKIIGYSDEKISLDVNASGNNFLFFGTTYMPNGWKAFIDGNQTNIYRSNYGFQGIVISQGKHNVEFVYEPSNFVLGKYLSLILNIVIIGGVVIVFIARQKKQSHKKDA